MILFIGNSRQGKNKMTLRIFLGARVGEKGLPRGTRGHFWVVEIFYTLMVYISV